MTSNHQAGVGSRIARPAECREAGQPFFTPASLADRWSWHVESVRRAVRQGRMDSVIIGRRRLIPASEVERIEADGRIARVV